MYANHNCLDLNCLNTYLRLINSNMTTALISTEVLEITKLFN